MRFLGRKWDEVTEEVKIVSYKVAKGPNHAVRFEIRGEREGRSQAEALFDSEDKVPERRPHRAPSATHREESAHGA